MRDEEKRVKTESKYRDRAAERRTGREDEETNANSETMVERLPPTEANTPAVNHLIAEQIAQMYAKSTTSLEFTGWKIDCMNNNTSMQRIIANQTQPQQSDFTLATADVELVKGINFSKRVSLNEDDDDDGEEFSKDIQDVSSEEEEEDFDMFAPTTNKQPLDSLSKDELVSMLHRVEDAMELKMKSQ